MAIEVDFDLTKAADRGRIRGWLDSATRLSGNLRPGPQPVTDQWRKIIEGLLDYIDVLEEERSRGRT